MGKCLSKAEQVRVKKSSKPRPKLKRRRGTQQQQRRGELTHLVTAPVAVTAAWGLPAQLRQAMAGKVSGYSADDRRVLLLLLLPFLMVATALATNHGWRTTRAYLPEIATPAPVLPPQVEAVLPLPSFAEVPAWPPPLPSLVRPDDEQRQLEQSFAALMPPTGLKWPPAPPGLAALDDSTGGPACRPAAGVQLAAWVPRTSRTTLGGTTPAATGEAFGMRLAQAARQQTMDLVVYSARYQTIAYPLGDVHALYGACTDVVIRAYRALGVDLQQLVQQNHAGSGDRSIDHRRTETLRRFFARAGASLPVSPYPEDYKPGDIVTYHRPFSRVSSSHIAIVSDVLAPTGRPMIVHNRGWGPQLEDALFVDRITGHYRFVAPPTRVDVAQAGVIAGRRGIAARRAELRARRAAVSLHVSTP